MSSKRKSLNRIDPTEHFIRDYLAAIEEQRLLYGFGAYHADWPSLPSFPAQAPLLEIRSGAIFNWQYSPMPQWTCWIEANTGQGLQKFVAHRVDAQVDPMPAPLAHIDRPLPMYRWEDPVPGALHTKKMKPRLTSATSASANPKEEISTAFVLERLNNSSLRHEERRQLIIDAESLCFTAEEITTLARILREFIEACRDSNDPYDVIAVGSAIRKLIATMAVDDLSSVALLLETGHRSQLPVDLELEVVKMVVRKLQVHSAQVSDATAQLAARLAELAEAYLNERLVTREKYGAIALNAVLALALLESSRLDGVIERIRSLRTNWFRQLVQRRARGLRDEIQTRHSKGIRSPQLATLQRLANRLTSV